MNTRQSNTVCTDPTRLIESLSEKLKSYYVFPDIAEKISACLQDHLQKGDYDSATNGDQFADLLTQHLQEVNQDRHLVVQWYAEPLPELEGPIHLDPGLLEEWQLGSRLDNYGLHKAERLPGNIGLLDIREFHPASWGGDTAAAAMTFLSNTEILIIDLRNCRGGDPDMIALLSSYLFGEERVQLSDLYWRETDVTEQYWTLPYVPGRRFGEKPIYLLIGRDTFSGGEAFAYDLKTLQRAILVGEPTKGGAHPGSPYRFDPHFTVFIPNGRAINPVTGTNWEGIGVTPDIAVPQDQAFTVAYQMALKSLIERSGKALSKPYGRLVEEALTALNDLES